IASMTIALSIIFSAATELAMAISSALLAEMALAMGLVFLFLGDDLVRALGGKRDSSRNERVRQYELGALDVRKGCGDAAGLGVVEQYVFTLDARQHGLHLLAAFHRLDELHARFMAGPVAIILEAGERPVDPRRADLQPVGALYGIMPLGLQRIESVRDAARE